MRSKLAARPPIGPGQTLQEARDAKPTLQVPFRLAVAPPLWRENHN